MIEVQDIITSVKGVGDKTASLFAKIGIRTVGELLFHYPFRYETYALPERINECSNGSLCSVEGIVISTPKLLFVGNKKITEVSIKDDSGIMKIKWFNAPYMKNNVRFGERYIFRGKVSRSNMNLTMIQPEVFTKDKYRVMLKNYKPIYSATEGLSQNMIGSSIRKALDEILIKEYLPAKIRSRYDLCGIKEALINIHFPQNEEMLTKALSRMVFDEFFFFMLNMKILKNDISGSVRGIKISWNEKLDKLVENIGFKLTADQEKVLDEIFNDMTGDRVMQRLLQGDVGSGKTVIALISLAAAALGGYQGCIMAPTEVLANQHFDYFEKMLRPMGINVGKLVGSMKKADKTRVCAQIESGEISIIVGTHAAIQDNVHFSNLALAVIDEQHRFGVRQRENLMLKGEKSHLLLMSATPIPRTYALMLYGDMDVSVIESRPADRLPIKNCVADEGMRPSVYRFIDKEISKGRQAYIICSLVEESETKSAAAVTTYGEDISAVFNGKYEVGILHGRMKSDDKSKIMEAFEKGEIDILVSTTVIEVGINVPNATVMLIENSESFGLAQLHQIRGRVGRGTEQSYCIFMAGKMNEKTKERLDIVAGSNDGFYIAGCDMKLRGPGDFFGIRQSGDMQFALADPSRDGIIMSNAREAADSIELKECDKIVEDRNNIVRLVQRMVY